MDTNYMGSLDWGILITYFVLLLIIGIWASRQSKQGSSSFVAGKSLRWYHIGFSMWGTNVGPSMLIASASAGFATGVVSGNFAWYAFIFITLLAFVFAPRYLGENVMTLPEFMGKRFGQSTRNMLAWYTIVTILISWLALTLFAGGILIEQIFKIEMWQSALILLLISAFFTIMGGLKAVAYTNVYQMLLLIFVSAALTIVGIYTLGNSSFIGGIKTLADPDVVPENYWHLFLPNDHKEFPWLPILLGYPISGLWFWCTDQSMVQPVLAAKSLKEGQRGANFTGWLKILDVALYIIPGIVCYALWQTGVFVYEAGANTLTMATAETTQTAVAMSNVDGSTFKHLADNSYLTMVYNLFPMGMIGLVMAVLTAALVSTIGSALNALSTVFSMDIYVKRIKPQATQKDISRTGAMVTVLGSVIAILMTIAIDSLRGTLDLFNIFQSVLGFIAPPMAAVFVMGVFWKRCTTLAANTTLTLGTLFSIGTGILYLWFWPFENFKPHFMLLSFYIFVILVIFMVIISLFGKQDDKQVEIKAIREKLSFDAIAIWVALFAVMIGLYAFFN
jgi:SSS family solute:Na+ symporter